MSTPREITITLPESHAAIIESILANERAHNEVMVETLTSLIVRNPTSHSKAEWESKLSEHQNKLAAITPALEHL